MKAINSYTIRITGILVLTLLRFGFSSSDALVAEQAAPAKIYLFNLLFAFITSAIMWEANRWLVVYFNKTSPYSKTGNKHFVKEIISVIILNAVIYVLYILVMMLIDPASRPHFVFLLYGLLDRVIYGLLVAGFYELLLFIHALRTATLEAEELKKLNLAIQLESLKNQVKPHFLFNSLNTLTGLVEKDTPKAVRFIAELSKVYRYLLQSNDKELIGLDQELHFTRAYFFLLEMRFGTGIEMRETINGQLNNYLIPPLTLQMLVENAVKHNQVSQRKPLIITIATEDDKWLIVQNNLQLKRNTASTGMGLSNIAAKFRLLNQPALEIDHDENFFTIKVPLIKSQS